MGLVGLVAAGVVKGAAAKDDVAAVDVAAVDAVAPMGSGRTSSRSCAEAMPLVQVGAGRPVSRAGVGWLRAIAE